MKLAFISVLSLFSVYLCGCNGKEKKEGITNPQFIDFSVRSSMPHDKDAFTQGFVVHNGQLFESTGQEGSWIGIIDIKTGKADKKVTLEDNYFGEGITIWGNKIYQLTWTTHKGFVYSLDSFQLIREFSYPTEGWGITHDNKNLIMSDGSHKLYFLDSADFSVKKTLEVNYQGAPVRNLNELEYVDGFIFANVWETNWIAKIDISTGEAVGFLDLTLLASQAKAVNPKVDVLNGIAWHEATQSLLVTGKLWPYIYVLRLDVKKLP